MKNRRSKISRQRFWQWMVVGAIVMVLLILEACSGNARVSGGVGIHRSSSGNWGHSISVGVHSHGGRW